MSFYTKIQTEIKDKQLLICALEELKHRGEINEFTLSKKKESIEVDRDGDILNISKEKTGLFNMAGDNRIVSSFSKRLAQIYAYEAIKENLPFDFEITEETEIAGEIKILLKG
ncbi:MAG: hypothetical protein IME98_02745 [Proteobacteria bacterium]|nr:hypothetical protein [Pseudomonadota bacterium]